MGANNNYLMLYAGCIWLGVALSVTLALVSWRKREVPGAVWLVIQNIAVAWWLLSYVLPMPIDMQRDAQILLRFKLIYFGVVWIAPTFLVLALTSAGHRIRHQWKTVLLFSVEPMLVWTTIWLAPLEGFFLGDWRGRPGDGHFTGGGMFWMHTFYSYTLLLAAMVVLVRKIRRESPVYRPQLLLMLLSALPPIVANVASLSKLSPVNIDYTPLGFVLASGMMAYAIFREGLFGIVPVARDIVIENMGDAVILMDSDGKLLDSNRAASRLFGVTRAMIGQPLDTRFAQWRDVPVQDTHDSSGGRILRHHEKYLDVRISALCGSSRSHGGLLLIARDTTEAVRASTELQQANEQLRHQLAENQRMQALLHDQAVRDGLTGLFNRRYLNETLGRELQYAMRSGSTLTVVLLDIDHFKLVNDTYGHTTGDEVLKTLGAFLAGAVRSSDIACRYGGEEFMVVLRDTSVEVAFERVEEWRRLFSQKQFLCAQERFNVTFSAGIAAYPHDAKDMTSLVKTADKMLYTAKDHGRNCTMYVSRALIREADMLGAP